MPPTFRRRSTAIFCLLSLLADARAEEVATPSSLLGPENFNHHPFEAGQYLKETEPTKQGPVVFPNDAPPPPRPPLIVTARPILESVARSELNPNPPQSPAPTRETTDSHNSIAEQTQLNRVHFKPGFLARVKDYKPFTYDHDYQNYVTPHQNYITPRVNYVTPHQNYVTPHENYVTPSGSYVTPNPIGPTPVVLVNAVTGKPVNGFGDYGDYGDGEFENPYADVVKKNRRLNGFGRDNRYDDYEEKAVLPPIYKALADYAKQNVLNVKQKNAEARHRKYKIKEPVYSTNTYQSNHVDEDDKDYSQNSNYAFSYIVKDKNTGDDFSHSQQSSGSATNGEYRVRLPDGRMQIVSYTADENGYKADVRYDDEDKTAGNNIDSHNYQSQNNYVANKQNYQSQNNYAGGSNSQNNHAGVGKSQNQNYRSNYAAPHSNQNYVVPTQNYVTPTKKVLISTNHNNYNQNSYRDHSNNNVDYTQINNQLYDQQRSVNQPKDYQKAAVKDEYYNQYGDVSNEYDTNDYSTEYHGKNDNYQPHNSKFPQLAETAVNQQGNVGVIVVPNNLGNDPPKPSLKPSYEDLRNLFIHKQPIPESQNYLYNKIPIELNVPSTTPRQNLYETTTEHVVVIGANKPNLYTNVRSSIPTVSPTSIYDGSTPSSFSVTPKNIDFSGPRPKLSSSFIDKINRYLSY